MNPKGSITRTKPMTRPQFMELEKRLREDIDQANNNIGKSKDPGKKNALKKAIRCYVLFIGGVYLMLRISDTCKLQFEQVMQPGTIDIREQKTGKSRSIRITEKVADKFKFCFQRLVAQNMGPYYPSDEVFNATLPYAHELVRELFTKHGGDLGIGSNKGSHIFRKTGARAVYDSWSGDKGEILEHLRIALNHSSAKVTERYICLEEETILQIYDLI